MKAWPVALSCFASSLAYESRPIRASIVPSPRCADVYSPASSFGPARFACLACKAAILQAIDILPCELIHIVEAYEAIGLRTNFSDVSCWKIIVGYLNQISEPVSILPEIGSN